MDAKKTRRQRRAKSAKRKEPKTRLNIFWHRQRKNFSIKNLVWIVKTIEYLPLEKRALREFLSRTNLTFDNFYRMLGAAKKIFEKDNKIEKEFWEKCLTICTPDNLVELTEMGESNATKELFRRIETGSIGNSKAKQVLIRLFEKITNEKTRMALWKKIKRLDLNEEELKYILDLPSMYALHKIVSQAQKLLRQIAKGNQGRNIKKLEELVEELKKE